MHKNKDQLYELIMDLKTKKEFEEEIKIKSEEYDGLLDDDTLALLIVDESGRNKQNICKISELKPDDECTVFGTVTEITPLRNFNRKNGSNGKVTNLIISDDTGSCKLVLWDDDTDLVKNNSIKIGTNVKIVNGYTKQNNFNEIELNVGRWSLIDVEPEDMPTTKKQQEQKLKQNHDDKTIKGILVELEPTRAFFKDDGEFGFVTNIKIEDKQGIKTLALWDKKVKEIQQFKQGDKIEIKNYDLRKKNGKIELHVNGRSTIKKL